jgi:hypothetical protein
MSLKETLNILILGLRNVLDILTRLQDPAKEYVVGHTDGVHGAPVQKLRTLQRYHGGPNLERMEYLEAHSPLTRRKLAVSAEQVSMFLTAGVSIPLLQNSTIKERSLTVLR